MRHRKGVPQPARPKQPDPTPEEIAEMCAIIRAERADAAAANPTTGHHIQPSIIYKPYRLRVATGKNTATQGVGD